jgi:hypothetical protein
MGQRGGGKALRKSNMGAGRYRRQAGGYMGG